MQKRILERVSKSLLTGSIFLVFFVLTSGFALAQSVTTNDAVFGGDTVKQNTETALGAIGQVKQDPRVIIAKVINVAMGFIGIIALTLILYAGYLWMMSNGKPDQIEKAKEILKNASIGLLIILSAWGIVSFIFSMFFNGTGNQNGTGGGSNFGGGLGALGSGIIASVYPEPNQSDVPRNTAIIVTFREKIRVSTICEGANDALGKCNGELIASTTAGTFDGPNVRIYATKQAQSCEMSKIDKVDGACKIYSAKVYSNDGRTFVFKTNEYLGSPSEILWHTVYLTDQLIKADGQPAFRSFDTVRDQSWSFEVSTRLDFDPPRIIDSGVFPAPDLAKDIEATTTAGQQASGNITINTTPKTEIMATAGLATSSIAGLAIPSASVSPSCDKNHFMIVYDKSNDIFSLKSYTPTVVASSGVGVISSDRKSVAFATCNLKLQFTGTQMDGLLTGNFWNLDVVAYQAPDTLTVGDEVYTASSSESVDLRLFKAADAINSLPAVLNASSQLVNATGSGMNLVIKSKIASQAGNSVVMTASDPSIFAISQLANGSNFTKKNIIKSRNDKPMNTVIQINFNEAMNPLTVSGKSDDIFNTLKVVVDGGLANGAACMVNGSPADNRCQSGACSAAGLCVGDYLAGSFAISNVYKTVEFVSAKQCGTNGCGEAIYCLPPSAKIRAVLVPSKIQSCTTDANCETNAPFSKCDNKKANWLWSSSTLDGLVCQNQADINAITNYPQTDMATFSIGTMDAAFNSLDGNRDLIAQGQMTNGAGNTYYYSDNSIYGMCAGGNNQDKSCTLSNKDIACGGSQACSGALEPIAAKAFADLFIWSFYTSDTMKVTPPSMLKAGFSHPINDQGIGLYDAIKESWSDVMMSATITTGEKTVEVGVDKVVHKFMNIGSFTGLPTGYWAKNTPIDNEPADGEIDYTASQIAHADFDMSTKYWSQIGSGLRDIYQNCFKPSNGPGSVINSMCAPDDINPGCCNGVKTANYASSTGIKPACSY